LAADRTSSGEIGEKCALTGAACSISAGAGISQAFRIIKRPVGQSEAAMAAGPENESLGARVARHLHAREATSRVFDLDLEAAGEGWARCSMIVRADMLNGVGVCHGGLIFMLADTAFAWACNSRNVKALAQQASISFLSPAQTGERLTAAAREESTQGRTGVYTVTVTGGDGRVVAVFQGLSRTAGGEIIE
jgi:acyl-CoA thioesterase